MSCIAKPDSASFRKHSGQHIFQPITRQNKFSANSAEFRNIEVSTAVIGLNLERLLCQLQCSVFGPCVLACTTRGGGQSEAGYCFQILLVQACLRAPPLLTDESKLAIVFTYFFLFFFFLLLFFSAFYFSPTSGNSCE